jgi:hypothetical protein
MYHIVSEIEQHVGDEKRQLESRRAMIKFQQYIDQQHHGQQDYEQQVKFSGTYFYFLQL